ncbi:transient receptor potential cation channel subfamily M member 3-like [Octopus sinensis]|uniref:Transient receptor potential cation channel subfamily M member 3-like n=1 Tax=Octopus sinensis TaxID=2607531 RepID=A0A7E6EIB1_9MOLL|nr:transient receptor potential cation channel subfamily M member 3-like [Octopus sinensis]
MTETLHKLDSLRTDNVSLQTEILTYKKLLDNEEKRFLSQFLIVDQDVEEEYTFLDIKLSGLVCIRVWPERVGNSSENDVIWTNFPEIIGCASLKIIFYSDTMKYIRLSNSTKIDKVIQLLTEHWGLNLPKLVISVYGGMRNFDLNKKILKIIRRGLIECAKTTNAWILTTGINAGAIKDIGESLSDCSRRDRSKFALIGISPWGVVSDRHRLINTTDSELEYVLTEALLNDDDEFVQLFLENNVSLHRYLTLSRLQDLYRANNTQDPESNFSQPDEFTPGKYPFNELTIWAVLTNRHNVAKFINGKGSNTKWTGSRYSGNISCSFQVDLTTHFSEFKKLAYNLLDYCYHEDDEITLRLLTYEMKEWSNHNCLSLAVSTNHRDFIAHGCCQMLITEMWIGGLRTSKYITLKVADCGKTVKCIVGRWLSPVIMSLYLIVANILLINSLIAVNTFTRINAISNKVWKFGRYQLTIEYEQKPTLPPPFNIFLLARIIILKYIKNKQSYNVRQESGLKLFLTAEEIEKIQDFEEECVDDYYRVEERKKKHLIEKIIPKINKK